MADQAEVEAALVGRIVAALYPSGVDQASLAGAVCRVYRGWPQAAALDADLGAGRVNVTVFPDGTAARDTTRWPENTMTLAGAPPTLSALSSGQGVTFLGEAAPGQVAGVLADGVAVAHRVGVGDTPELVAAILGQALRDAGRVVAVSGASLAVPGAGLVLGRVVADQPVLSELRRQEQGFRITAWCPSAASRDLVAGIVDRALAASVWLALGDGSAGLLGYRSSTVFDQSLNARLYRRDLIYAVEYPTTLAENLPSMLFGTMTVAANGGPVVAERLS